MSSSQAAVVLEMARACSPQARAELRRAVITLARPRPEPATERLAELGALAEMLAEIRPLSFGAGATGQAWRQDHLARIDPKRQPPHLEQVDYDARRPASAPPAQALADRHGTWHGARRAAYGLLSDGRYVGTGRPWTAPTGLGLCYTRDDCVLAWERCSLRIGYPAPTSDYYRWRRAYLDRSRSADYETKRLPTLGIMLKHAGRGGWWSLATDANLSADAFLRAREAWMLPGDRRTDDLHAALAGLPIAAWVRAGLTASERTMVLRDGLFDLRVGQAAALAHAAGGSVRWIAGLEGLRGEPPTLPYVVDMRALPELRKQAGLSEQDVISRLGVGRALMRRLARWEPTLGQLRVLADAGIDLVD